MSGSSTRTESYISMALIALLLIVGVSLTDVANPQPDLRASTFVNDETGLRALYLTLEAAGLDVQRSYEPVQADEPTDRTLVLAAPTDPLLDREIDSLLDWVDAGGRLVVVHEPSAPPLFVVYTSDLLLALGRRSMHFLQHDVITKATLHPDLPHQGLRFNWRSRRRLMAVDEKHLEPHQRRKDPRVGAATALVSAWGVPFAEEIELGAGSVVLIADTLGLDNGNLHVTDHAILAADLLAGPDGREAQIVFDEFHHGFRPDGQKDDLAAALLALLLHSWPGRAVLALLLAMGVFVAGRTVRFGAPLPKERSRRRELTEHTTALGQVYATARARTAALRLIAAGARRRIGTRVGLSARMSPAEFDRRLGGCAAPGAAELARALTAAQSAQGHSDSELVQLAHDLTNAKRRFTHGRS